MKVHLIDGTYELFRAYFAIPSLASPAGEPVSAVRGIIQTLLALLRQDDVTHIASAFDHTIESFRNELFDGYKTGEGVPSDLMSQFDKAEEAVSALGIVVWPMTEFEADDAIATAATRLVEEPEVNQVVICSPDKDLAQVVRGREIVCLDRRKKVVLDESGVLAKFGVPPVSIPDYLALVGDSADGIPGIPRWGAKTTSQVLTKFPHVEDIPDDPSVWDIELRGLGGVATSLAENRDEALLYRQLAKLRLDVPLSESLDELGWHGVNRKRYTSLCARFGFSGLADLPHRWSDE